MRSFLDSLFNSVIGPRHAYLTTIFAGLLSVFTCSR